MRYSPHTTSRYLLGGLALKCLLFGCIALSCTSGNKGESTGIDIPYPLPLPDSTAIAFLPGLVSKDSLDFNAAFSPDGKSFYFTRSENKQLKIYVSHHDGRNWAEPMRVPFTETKYSEADPAFAPDGKLYFISNRPKNSSDSLPDYDLWFITPLAEGGWSEPENLIVLNSDSSEFYISFSENGNLYFSSSRKGGFGQEDIYVSRLINDQYSAPENIGPSINSEKSEYDPGISADEEFIIFTSSNREDTFGAGDLYCSRSMDDKNWKQATNLGKVFNTKTREYCAYFSPDLNYFFFTSERDVKWIDARFLKNHIDKLLK